MRGVANSVPKPEESCPELHQLQIGTPKMFQDLRCSGGMNFFNDFDQAPEVFVSLANAVITDCL